MQGKPNPKRTHTKKAPELSPSEARGCRNLTSGVCGNAFISNSYLISLLLNLTRRTVEPSKRYIFRQMHRWRGLTPYFDQVRGFSGLAE